MPAAEVPGGETPTYSRQKTSVDGGLSFTGDLPGGAVSIVSGAFTALLICCHDITRQWFRSTSRDVCAIRNEAAKPTMAL
ncbi:Protein of unknown function [Gryllus bimaculatus]|nr:Protein of unknown function [Gryllus bimaculatus]